MHYTNEAIQAIIRHLLTNCITDGLLPAPDKAAFSGFCLQYFKEIAYLKADGVDLRVRKPYTDYTMYTDYDDSIILDPAPSVKIAPLPAHRVSAEVPIAYPEELPEKVSLLLRRDRCAVEYRVLLKCGDIGLRMSLEESLIVLNTLAAKHAEIRGGAWSGLGKRLELPLMLTLARLFQVPQSNFSTKRLTGESREVDFHYMDRNGIAHYCEVKLMGRGNPESADSAIARDSNIFIADTLSDANKEQLTRRKTQWVELRQSEGYQKLYRILEFLAVPCAPFTGDLDAALDDIIPAVFAELD